MQHKLMVLALLWAGSCAVTPDHRAVGADDPKLRYVGWFDTSDARAPRFAWPGTQIHVRFTGTSLHARLSDTPGEGETRETDWINVVVDGGPPKTFTLAEGMHLYPLATGLAEGTHSVALWKRTEAKVGTITFEGFVLDRTGSVVPTPRVARRMLFVGDSITAGYGNEGPDGDCHWSAAHENNYETYGAHAARTLGAEYVAMAWSGKGLTRNYQPYDVLTLPQVYERVIPTEDTSPRIARSHADVVVVNVGTNDFFQGTPDETAFTAAYRTLLEALRARYPHAWLVLGVGPMLAEDSPQPLARSLTGRWVEAVRQSRHAAGDTRVELIELWIDPAEGVGCDFHPNVRTHRRLGAELATLVRARLGW